MNIFPTNSNQIISRCKNRVPTLVTVGSGQFLSLLNGLRQVLENGLGIFPIDTRVGDTDTVFQAGLALWRNLLVAYTWISYVFQ